MSYNIKNVSPAQVTAAYDAGGAIDLLYGTVDLSLHSDALLVELSSTNTTKIRVPDFTHASVVREVYVFEVNVAGGLTGPWSRVSGGAESATLTYSAAPVDLEIVVLAVTAGSSAPTPASKSAAQQSGAGIIRVKIRREGELPIPSRRS